MGAVVAREGIKADNKVTSLVASAFKRSKDITALKDSINRKEARINDRGEVGMKIRRWDSLGGHWRLQALFALLVEIINSDAATGKSFSYSFLAFSQPK